MTLREARCLFTHTAALLVQRVNGTAPYSCALGEVHRTDEQATINALREEGRARLATHLATVPEFAGLALAVSNNGKGNGILLSVHRDGLAVDLMLYKEGVWCQDAKDYEQFGQWWKQQHSLCRWGGDFRDPAHFSLEWQGRR